MKNLVCLLFVFCTLVFASAESLLINYKGMELGAQEYPEWVRFLFEKDDERILRKKFKIEKKENVFYSTSTAEKLEFARNDAERKIFEEFAESGLGSVSGLEFVADYWEQIKDSKTKKTEFVLYLVYKKKI